MVDKVNNGKPTGLSLDVSFPNGETKNYTFGEAALAGIDYTDITGNSGKQYYHYKDSSGADKYTTDITNLPASISINEETGNIKITAPKSITDSDMFKQVFDEDTLKQYSQAYKLNPEYKISVREKNEETGEEEDKEITIPEYVQRLNSSIENYMKNLRDIHTFRDILREKYGDKADNMSDEIVQIAKMNGGKALYVPESILNVSSFGNVPNPFKELKSKMTDDGLVSTEEFSKIWIRNNFGRDEIAAILAHIDGHLRQSDWSEDETYTDYDGITHNNRNSATEAAKLIAFRNYITSNNPTATNFQQMGDYIESLTYNAAQQTTKIFGDLAGTAQWVFSGNNDSSILDYVQEMDEAMEYFNEDNVLVWDAITNAQIWGSLGGMALGTWGAAKLLSVPFKLAGKVSSAFTSRYLNVASHIGELVENGSKISLGAQMAFKAMTVAEKVNLGINMAATGISNAVGGSFFLQFVFDTMHDAILYDANGFKDMMVKMSEQSEFDQKAGVALQYWGEQFADNTKWWAPMGAGRALIKTAGKTALGKATNVVLTKYINKVESAIGTKFQGWQDDLGSGTVISRLQEKIDKAKNQGKKAKVQRLETKKQIEEQLVDIRRARAQIGDVKLDWDGVKLTEESAKEWANAMTRLKAVENGIDNYIRGVEAKTREMFTAIKDPATGKPMFLFEELAGANIKASKWYYKLVDLSSKHGLSVAKNSLLNQDVIDYWMGSYKRDIYKAFADSGTENGAKAEKALETINNNLEILKSRLPEDITKYIDDGIKNKVYQDFYRQLNKYGVENKLLVKDTIDSYESNPIWVENGYMPIAHDVDPGGRWIREDDKIEAIIEQEMDKLKFGAKEGEHFRDPELVRQVRSRHMAQASVNKDLWKSYSGWGSNATNITVVSGEETEFARKIQESQKALKNEISKQASAAFEQKILGEFTITKKKPVKNENLSIETRGEIVSDMSPSEVSEYLSNRVVNGKKVIDGSQGTIVQTVTPENYDEWYGSQSKQVRNYLWSKKQGVSEDNPYAGWTEGELDYEKGTITDKMSKKRTAIFYNEKDGVDYVGNSKRTGDSMFIEENLEQSDSVPVDTNGKNIFGGTEAKGSAYKTKNNVVLYETVDLEDASAFGKKAKGAYKDSPGTHASTFPSKTDVKDGYTRYILRKHVQKGTDVFVLSKKTKDGKFLLPESDKGVFVRTGELDANGNEIVDVYIGISAKDSRLKNIVPKPKEEIDAEELAKADKELIKEVFGEEEAKKVSADSSKEYSDKILSEYEAERQAYATEGEKRLAQIEEAREASRVTYKDFKEMSEQGGVDFEEGLQRAWVLGDPNFAKSPMANEAARNLAAGKDAFYQGTFLAKAKGKLKNIKKVDGDDFVDDMAASTQIMVDRFVEQVLAAPGAKDVIKALAGTSDGAGDVARFYALQELLKPENFKKASSAIDEQIELMRKKLGLNADDVDLLKDTAKDILKDTVKSESDSARLAAKTLNAELTDAKALSDEVKEINDRIKAADKRLGEDYVMYLDDNGRKVYAKVDPAFASLFSYRYRMEKVDASVFARINGFMSRMYRYGTTSVNLSSFGNQLFRDFGNAILVGGAWQTIKANADNLVSVFGQNIVDQIKRFEPEEMARIEKISDETGRTLEDIAVSRELVRGAAKAPSSTERTLYKTFMKEAYGNPNTVLEKMQTRLQKIVDKWNPEELLNGKRENYLRNRVYASSLNDAMKQGYTLEQSRVFAEFAMNNATTNFTRQLYHMQAIADSTPYFRAAINGTKSFWRMWSVDPVGITGRIVGGLILPTMYLTGASLGDEESRKIYMNMPEYMKEDSMVFVFNGQAVSIPIPQELGQIVAPFRHFVEYLSNNAQKNDFWELMMNDLLGYSPIDLKGFTSIDMDKMISDPTIFDRIGRGMARAFSQMAPVPIKSAYMLATGTDPYSGKSLRDSSYMYWNDETNSVEVMDYNQNAFATWFAKLFGGWMSPELAEKVVSGTVGSTGSNLLGGFTKLLQEGPEASAKDLGDKFAAQVKNPFDVNEYNYADAVWRRAIKQLTSEKEAILNSEEMKVINNKLAQTKDPDVREKVLAERQDIVDNFHQRVGDTINRLSSVYNGTFDRQKFAAVINLLNFNSNSAYQSGSQYSSNISSELFWDGQDAAIHTMERLGVTGTNDTSIFGYLTTDKDGNPIVKYTSPVAIMDMDRQWGNQDDIHAANIKALVSQNDLYDAHKAITKQVQSIYDSKDKLTSQDKANIEAIQINWNAQLAKTIAPYVATMTPEAAINNTEVLNALYPYVEVPGSWEVNDKGKGVYLGNRGNKKKAYYESWIKSMFGVNDPYKGQY